MFVINNGISTGAYDPVNVHHIDKATVVGTAKQRCGQLLFILPKVS